MGKEERRQSDVTHLEKREVLTDRKALLTRATMQARSACAAPSKAALGARKGLKAPRSLRCSAKKDIHPEFHSEAKVICNGEEVFTVAGTKKEYVVDVWSGNHPFYLNGQGSAMILDDERIPKFNKKYAGLDLFGGSAESEEK